MPVPAGNGGPPLMIHEVDLLHSLVSGKCKPEDTVLQAAKPMAGMVSIDDPLSKVQAVFDENNVAIVMDNESVIGLISKIDVVEFLTARSGW